MPGHEFSNLVLLLSSAQPPCSDRGHPARARMEGLGDMTGTLQIPVCTAAGDVRAGCNVGEYRPQR